MLAKPGAAILRVGIWVGVVEAGAGAAWSMPGYLACGVGTLAT